MSIQSKQEERERIREEFSEWLVRMKRAPGEIDDPAVIQFGDFPELQKRFEKGTGFKCSSRKQFRKAIGGLAGCPEDRPRPKRAIISRPALFFGGRGGYADPDNDRIYTLRLLV